jgi:prepilin-type N-terminal cleavage/methylation domain-containing protein
MRRTRGFTLIEVMIVLAVVAILATVSAIGIRTTRRNAGLSTAAYGLLVQLRGLRAVAMSENKEYVFLFADAPGSDASACSSDPTKCARFYVLAQPTPTWALADFDTAAKVEQASLVKTEILPGGVHLDTAATFTPADPFSAIPIHDADLTRTCKSGERCFAIRFSPTGAVRPDFAGTKLGYAFVLGSDLNATSSGAHRRGILITFPSGIVKSNAF